MEINIVSEELSNIVNVLSFLLADFRGTRMELLGAKNLERVNIVAITREFLLANSSSVTTNQIVAHLNSNFISKTNLNISSKQCWY
jgi:hypothetical protein